MRGNRQHARQQTNNNTGAAAYSTRGNTHELNSRGNIRCT